MSMAHLEKKARRLNLILSIRERAIQAGFHPDTLRAEIAKGVGPAVIKLSTKRYGITDDDWEAWINSRRITAPISVEEEEEDEDDDGTDDALAQAQDTVPPAAAPAALQTRKRAPAPSPRRQTLEEKIRHSFAGEEEAAIPRQISPAPLPQPRQRKLQQRRPASAQTEET
jgi:hypothetical protein